jgi:5-amino-6-(5-phosphoribosylamino)uracil reductase
VGERPYVVLSCSTSIDGCLDDASSQRLMLSNDADFDRVDATRAGCDAIMVGARTVRRDNPRLLVRCPDRRAQRLARGVPETPAKVVLTGRGCLDPDAAFFTCGDAERLVYAATPGYGTAAERLGARATVLDAGDPVDLGLVLADLYERGVERLMVEGGQTMHTQLIGEGLADELHLSVAPLFVGEAQAPRLLGAGRFPQDPGRRALLAEVRQIGDVVLLRYGLSERFDREALAG